MRSDKVRLAAITAVMVVALLVPMAAMANNIVLERGLVGGLFVFNQYDQPDVSGNNVVLLTKSTLVPAAKWQLDRFNLITGDSSSIASDTSFDIQSPAIDGDWAVWEVGGDIHAKNIATGAVKNVTNDALTTIDLTPAVSGTYVVWTSYDGATDGWDVWGKNLASSAPKFLVAGGTGDQSEPSIYGKRVAYRDASALTPLLGQIKVKTIGSSADPDLITSNLIDQNSPSIGDHLVAWRATGIGHQVIKYFNYDTGTTSVAASGSVDMQNPQVSGDRILYDASNGSNQDMWIFDVRVNRAAAPFQFPFAIDNTSSNEIWGKISGNTFVYLSGAFPVWGKINVPSVSIGTVPTRIPHAGKLHLTGKLSDLGIPLGGATLRLEKYVSGRWNLVKTIQTSSLGTYSTNTPSNPAGKTKYRMAYDGLFAFLGAQWYTHPSAVSSTRTAWPR
jgi:hypothetical protein